MVQVRGRAQEGTREAEATPDVAEADRTSQILDSAERLVQRRGFNGFSYADIAAELHITKAALHYHFAGKSQLGEALIRRYTARFEEALAEIDDRLENGSAKLQAYADIYLEVLRDQRMCLCGMLAAEYQTLPQPMQDAVVRYFDANQVWLERILRQGRQDGTLDFDGSPVDLAQVVIGSFEGAMLVARPYGDVTRFKAMTGHLLAGFATPTPVAGRRPERR